LGAINITTTTDLRESSGKAPSGERKTKLNNKEKKEKKIGSDRAAKEGRAIGMSSTRKRDGPLAVMPAENTISQKRNTEKIAI